MSLIFPPVTLGPLRWEWARTCVWGVVNVTPDSFYPGARHADHQQAVEHGLALAEQGADILDVGGESTRPGSVPLPVDQELDRVLPVVRALACDAQRPVSIDTTKAEVARAAVEAGAAIINDVSGLTLDEAMASTVAALGVPVVIGHLRGRPATMQQDIAFADVVTEVIVELRQRVQHAIRAGIRPANIWVDPGLGFGKTAEQTTALLAGTERIRQSVGYPMLVGPSRKAFLGAITGQPVEQRLMGTSAAVTAAIIAGADAVRVHDVGALRDVVRVADALRSALPGSQAILT